MMLKFTIFAPDCTEAIVINLKTVGNYIISLLDWIYPLFRPFLPPVTFRYAACGGFNTALDIVLYFFCFHFVLHEQILNLGFVAISPHIASFLLVFPFTFTSGFVLGKYVTFSQSELRGRVQLFRYIVTVAGSILLNYIFLKFFVEYCHLFPTISKILTTVFVILYSYLVQRHYTFKIEV